VCFSQPFSSAPFGADYRTAIFDLQKRTRTIAIVTASSPMQPTNLFACGFLSAASGQAPDNFSAVLPLPLAAASALQVDKVFSGGWGFALACTVENELCCWGCNQPTLLKKSGGLLCMHLFSYFFL
jgi:hypothetical protein